MATTTHSPKSVPTYRVLFSLIAPSKGWSVLVTKVPSTLKPGPFFMDHRRAGLMSLAWRFVTRELFGRLVELLHQTKGPSRMVIATKAKSIHGHSREGRTAVAKARLILLVMVNVAQLWILSATVEAALARRTSALVPLVVASGICLLITLSLIYLWRPASRRFTSSGYVRKP